MGQGQSGNNNDDAIAASLLVFPPVPPAPAQSGELFPAVPPPPISSPPIPSYYGIGGGLRLSDSQQFLFPMAQQPPAQSFLAGSQVLSFPMLPPFQSSTSGILPVLPVAPLPPLSSPPPPLPPAAAQAQPTQRAEGPVAAAGGEREMGLPPAPKRKAWMRDAGTGEDDGYRWRKYGNKTVKSSGASRAYYKCTVKGCPMRKMIVRQGEDGKGPVMNITYKGNAHNHDPEPRAARGRASSSKKRQHEGRQATSAQEEDEGEGEEEEEEESGVVQPQATEMSAPANPLVAAALETVQAAAGAQQLLRADAYEWKAQKPQDRNDVEDGLRRTTYLCSTDGCPARKIVEFPESGTPFTFLSGVHSHPPPHFTISAPPPS